MIQAQAARVQAVGGVRSLTFDAGKRLMLASGDSLAPLTIAFETYGALNVARSNAVLVCHALDGDQFVAGPNPITGKPAWWPRIVGPGRPIDTNRYFVVCANVLGGSMGATGPGSPAADGLPYGLRFPSICVADIVRAQDMLVAALGIDSLFLAIGPGFGGMQALNWASAYPKRVFACIAIAAAARQSPQNLALAELARQAIMADPDWRSGAYATQGVRPARGAAIARSALRMTGASARFMREGFQSVHSGAQADSGAERLDANSFLYLSRAVDSFDLARDFGGDLANAFRGGATRYGVFAFSSDWRAPPSECREVTRALIAAGAEASFFEVQTEAGHDAYLGEEPALEAALTGFIDAAASARGIALNGGAA